MSLGLCLGASVLWVRSYWVEDRVERTATFGTARDGRVHNYYVWSNRGELFLCIYQREYHTVAADDHGPTPQPIQWLTDRPDPRLTVAYAAIDSRTHRPRRLT